MSKINFIMEMAETITSNMCLLKDAFLKIGRNEELTWKDTVQVICQNNRYMMIQYSKGGRTEYHIHTVSGWNAEDRSWNDGEYAYSLESAMVVFLDKCGDNRIKSNYQLQIEEKYPDMTYARCLELLTLCKDGLIEDDEDQAYIYFDETCEMTVSEKECVGIETESEDEEW